jgi:hypothetical protein
MGLAFCATAELNAAEKLKRWPAIAQANPQRTICSNSDEQFLLLFFESLNRSAQTRLIYFTLIDTYK